MSAGTGSKVAVFAAVLAVTGGLGWLLHEAGKVEEETDPDAPASAAGPAGKSVRRLPPVPDPIVVEPPPPAPTPKPPPPGATAPIPVAGHDDLKLRHWAEAANAFVAQRALMLAATETGMPRPDDPQAMAPHMKTGGEYGTAVIGPPAGFDESTGKHTPLTHPAFVVNMIAALLERAHLPVSQAQAERLGALALERGELVDKADAVIATDDGTYMLDRLIARTEILDRFYSEAFSALTPAQSEAVSPEAGRGRLQTDLLSTESIWGRMLIPMPYEDATQVAETIASGLSHQFGVFDRMAEMKPIVAEWVPLATGGPLDTLEQRGFLKTARVSAAARRMSELLHKIAEGMRLEPPALDKVREVFACYVLIRR